MLYKIIIASLFVYGTLSKSSFIGDVKRAELFEKTDEEVAVFRVTLPEEEFAQLKENVTSRMSMFPGMGSNGEMKFPSGMIGEDGSFQFPGMGENSAFPFPGMGEDGAFPFPGMGEGSNEGFPFPGMGEGSNEGFPFPGMGEGGEGAFPSFPFDEESFKTKNATMTVELNNKEKKFDEVTLSIGGSSSRTFGKQGFNLKIRNKKKDLYGRSQFRLRPDAREATFLRSKLTCDIHNRLGLPSISANYATLYINGEYMGFYILLDAIKLSWVEYVYDDKDSTTLYQCKNMNNQLTVKSSSTGCTNENEEVTDHSEWIELLTRLDAAQSAEDIEDIFDVDQFLTEIAFEYLSGSWDHYLNFGHNFYMYKPKGDKWKFLLYDFDGELGQDISMGAGGGPGQFDASTPKTDSTDYPTYTFEEWAKPRHLIDILILKDSTRFDNILRNVVKKAFNPTVLFPHIDELKKFIRPYVELDKTPDENGKYPGRLNEKAGDYTLAQWEANSEFTKITSAQGFGQSYGLKYWILAKYRYVCKAYTIEDCDPVYLDENYEIPVDKEVEAKGDMTAGFPPFMQFKNKPTEPSTDNTDTSDDVEPPVDNTDTSDDVEPPADNTDLVVEPPAATDSIKPPTATTPAESLNCITKKPSDFIKKKCFAKKGSKSSIKSSEKSSYESEKTSDETEKSSYESEKTSDERENSSYESEKTSYESENTTDENENTSNESENTTDENENTSNESENTSDENENTSNESENTSDENENTSDDNENSSDESENPKIGIKDFKNIKNFFNKSGKSDKQSSNNKYDSNKSKSDKSKSNKSNSNKHDSKKDDSSKYNSNKQNSNKYDSSKYDSKKQDSSKYSSNKYDSKKQNSNKQDSDKKDKKNSFLQKIRNLFL